MKIFRITDHKLYHSLTDHEKLCYKYGLPIRFMQHNIKNMVFMDYDVGRENPKTISAPKQKKWAMSLAANMSRHNNTAGIITCYSSPTDTAAFECAGALFQAGVETGMSCLCVSASRLAEELNEIPKNDLYLIYGITDNPSPLLDRCVKSFLYERDGSLRILVVAGSDNHIAPFNITENQLRLKTDVLLMLNDVDDLNFGKVKVKAG